MALRLAAPDSPNSLLSLELIPADSLRILNLVLKNAMKEELSHGSSSKYHKVNLSGKAGAHLVASDLAMTILKDAGWENDGVQLVLTRSDRLSEFSNKVSERYNAIAPSASASAPKPSVPKPSNPQPTAPLSFKQQALRKKEEEERKERLAALKAKAKKRGATNTQSIRADARRAVEEAEKKLADEQASQKETTIQQLKMDKIARKADDWVASVAGDKSKGKAIERFRDKHGEDCC
ncbi:hypothetical protein TrCOL_g13588 [Triparma columacea]|uniref:PUB domain-containing protein n=1 Tax=Triparma columacea TaxID=722753 RepID=A0A9W7LCF5_9STRA|nr:hypothetical protein TrCOL_g13588 [Triparma columacea]